MKVDCRSQDIPCGPDGDSQRIILGLIYLSPRLATPTSSSKIILKVFL